MNCEELRDLYELYTLGLLDGEEREEIDTHLARGCEACRKSLGGAQVVNAMLMASVPEVQPPARLKRRVMASVGAQPVGWTWAAALAAACMLVVALWLSDQERRRANELAQTRGEMMQVVAERDRMLQALSFLNQPGTRQIGFGKGPQGNVFLNPSRGVLLISSNLPRLDPGKIFEMWLIPKGASPRPAGLFTANPDGTAVHVLSGTMDFSTLDAVAVTIEPESGSPGPTSTPIIAAPVAP
jgi:anti-sigma-K factor RskA